MPFSPVLTALRDWSIASHRPPFAFSASQPRVGYTIGEKESPQDQSCHGWRRRSRRGMRNVNVSATLGWQCQWSGLVGSWFGGFRVFLSVGFGWSRHLFFLPNNASKNFFTIPRTSVPLESRPLNPVVARDTRIAHLLHPWYQHGSRASSG